MDEAVFAFGTAIENELNGMEKGKHEKPETFAHRKHAVFLKLLGQEKQIKYASPIATR